MRLDLQKIIDNKGLTQLEQQVLEYVLEHIHNAITFGVRKIAKDNYTSTSTIMRVAKKLGYKGFIDMVYNLIPLVEQDPTPFPVPSTPLFGNDLNILRYISEAEISQFIALLKAIHKQIIFIYATGFSKIMAEYLNKKLLLVGKKCILLSGNDSIGIFENNLMDIEILMVISKSGETKLVLDKVTIAKQQGSKVISFTKEIANSVARLSDLNFKIFDMHKLDDRNMSPNTFYPHTCMLMEYLIYRYLKADTE